MSDPFLESWGQLSDPDPQPQPAPPSPAESMDAGALVGAIIGDENALAELTEAIVGDTPKDKLYVFATLPEFLEEYLLELFQKALEESTVKWCEEWWKHSEARAALSMLWDSWEAHRRAPASMVDWLVRDGWPVFDRLTGPLSPFDGCQHTVYYPDGTVRLEAHHKPRQRRLPVKEAPADLFAPRPTKTNPNP